MRQFGTSVKRLLKRAVVTLLFSATLIVVIAAWLGLREDSAPPAPVPLIAGVLGDRVTRGAYLVTAGNCRSCHTERGGAPFAGGRSIVTPFGEFRTPNITPDPETGIGQWSDQDFWRALHEGKRPDGTLLYPSFPYTHYTQLGRDDVDSMYAYFRNVAPIRKENAPHVLRFPYDQRWLLIAWRALYFRSGSFRSDASRDTAWNRGAYLVRGLTHCDACHEARSWLGAIHDADNAAGGIVMNWYAPALDARSEASVSSWTEADIVALLSTGLSPKGSAFGPMAEVVYESLQHLRDEDLRAMASYLQSLPERTPRAPRQIIRLTEAERSASVKRGAHVYSKQCADCHGEQGEGISPAGCPLAGNRAVTMASSVNPIRVVLQGGYPPGTKGNSRPFGMPPFGSTLTDQQIADVLTYVRGAWGNTASGVLGLDVARLRSEILW
jgi:mono/diheme cytochrome c family protein